MSRRLLGLAFAVLLLVASGLRQPEQANAAEENYLSVLVSPPRVPADGASYDVVTVQLQNKSGFPMPALDDTRVVLTSSRVEAGRVEPFVTVAKGATFTVAKFTSTLTPGQTNITASATGYIAASRSITTVEPSGSPKALSVNLGPSRVLPESGASGIITVQLLDVSGMPSRAPTDINVTLSSSLGRIAQVDKSLIIRAKNTFGKAKYTTTFAVGETTITVSASGYSTSSAVLRVVGPIPTKLVAYASPPVVPERSGAYSTIAIQLQDPQGVPAKAPADIPITLTSPDDSSARTQEQIVTIPSGRSYTVATVLGGVSGVAQVTASVQGYEAAVTTIRVEKRQSADTGKLGVYLAPPTLPPATDSLVVVQTQNASGKPIVATKDIDIHLASSNTSIGLVETSLRITRGTSQATAKFRSTLLSGTTVITASANSFDSASATVRVVEAVPNKLALRSVPATIPADGGSYDSIIVELQDANGLPAKAPSDIIATLSSSRTDVGTVSATATIRSGTSFSTASLQTTLVAGATNITASAPGFAASSPLTLNTVKPTPSQLVVYAEPGTLQALPGKYETVTVQIQDAAGVPGKAPANILLFLSSSDPTVGTVDLTITVPAGSTFAKAGFQSTGKPGATTITATASGYDRGSAVIKTVLAPLTIRTTSSITPTGGRVILNTLSTATLRIYAESGGKPVPDATVSWNATTPILVNETRSTDSSGFATVAYRPLSPGNSTVQVTVRKAGYTPASSTILFTARALTLTASIQAEKTRTEAGQPVSLKAQARDPSGPIQNASLAWTTNIGSFSRPSASTDNSGEGSTVFFSNTPGVANITVTVQKSGYLAVKRSLIVNVTAAVPPPPPPPTNRTTTQPSGPLGLDIYQITTVAEAVALAALVVVLIRSRRGKEAVIDEELA